MIVTKYICDKCNHEQGTATQMWEMGVHCQSADRYSSHPTPYMKSLWCRACVEAIGLLPRANPPPPSDATAAPPSLEEIIRELARQEVTAMTGAA